MQHFLKVLVYLKPYKMMAFLNTFSNILASIFTIVSFLVLKPFLDILFLDGAVEQVDSSTNSLTEGWIEGLIVTFNAFLSNYIATNGKQAGLVLVASIIIGTFFMKNFFRYLALYFIAPVRYGIEKDIRQNVFQHLMCLPVRFFSNERKGDLMSRITIDVQEIQWSVLQSLETLIRSPFMIFSSLGIMLYISPMLTGFSFILILFIGVIIGGIGKTLKRQSSKAQDSQGRLLSILDEAIGGLRIVRAFNAEGYQNQKFASENQYYFKTMNKMIRRRDLSSPLTEFLGVFMVAVLLLFGGTLVFQGHFEASTFVVFVMMFYNIIDPAKSFSGAYYAIQKGRAATERVEAILAIDDEHKGAGKETCLGLKQEIVFDKVSFAFEEGNNVLENINLVIPAGSSVALVGASGAGKSTLIDLVPRFQRLSEGKITIDGQDISQFDLKSLHP